MTQEFLQQHPFRANLLRRLDNGELTHINSYYEGLNDEGVTLTPYESHSRKQVFCNSAEEINAALQSPNLKGRQQLYIVTPLKGNQITQLKDNG